MKKYSSIEQFRNVIKAVQLKHDYKGKDESDNPIYRHTEIYPTLKFKSKGEKHSVTNVKKLNSVNTEMMNSINEFVEYAVTENRLEQGISYFNENNIEIDSKNTGQFLSWVVRDVLKEESDTIETNNLDDKSLKKAIVTKARVWFLNKI